MLPFTYLVQLKRLELKLKQFAEVESLLIKECEQLERARQRGISRTRPHPFVSIWTCWCKQTHGSSRSRPVSPSIVNTNPAPSRLQQVPSRSGSPAQAFISGFPSNQLIHQPQMSQQQQSMFGLGPRLPHSAIFIFITLTSHVMTRVRK